MDQKILALLVTLFLGVFIAIGAIIAFSVKNKEKFIDFAIAFAFSVILMILFTDLIPEVSETLGTKHVLLFLVFIIVGVVLLRILDIFVPDHEHEHHEKKMTKKEEKNNLAHIGIVASIALVLHNIIEGMAIYSTCVSSLRAGIMISLGVGCHNIPLGMVITSTIHQNKKSKKKTILTIAFLMLSTFLGGLIMFLMNGATVSEMFLGILLSITIGMLVYICSNELYPRIKKTKNKKITGYGLLLGVLLILISNIF